MGGNDSTSHVDVDDMGMGGGKGGSNTSGSDMGMGGGNGSDTSSSDMGMGGGGGGKQDAAAIINSSAGVIDSIAKLAGIFGQPNGSGTNYNTANRNTTSTKTSKPNWLLIGGIGGGFLLIIALLYIASKNGNNKGNNSK